MRLFCVFLGLALLLGGAGLCFLNPLARALRDNVPATLYFTQMEKVPFKDSYTRAEVADAAWEVWTNRMSLPAQSKYSVWELKQALLIEAGVFGTQEETGDRSRLEYAVRDAAGFRWRSGNGLIVPGVLLMLIGSFLLGSCTTNPKEKLAKDLS